MTVRCAYCNQPVNPNSRTTWRRVEGWERKAVAETRKSGSDIVLREPVDLFACPVCVMRIQNGLNAGQRALL